MLENIEPLDLILFRGVDAVSGAIGFFERHKSGRGDYSHAGLAVSREVLDLPCLAPGKLYVWESTLTAESGFWARFTDKIPDAEGDNVRFGVQLRDLELVVPAYESSGGKVAWSHFIGQHPPPEEVRKILKRLHDEYGHAVYDTSFIDLFGVVFPALRKGRDEVDRVKDRRAHRISRLLERAHSYRRVRDTQHRLFCSEWVALVYKRLGVFEIADPRNVAPVDFIARLDPDQFAEPVPLEANDA